jgi:ATP-dependent DNA helicase RecG
MRPEPLFRWFSSLENLKGVGEAVYGHLRRLLRVGEGETARWKDIVFHFPVEVLDRRNQELRHEAVGTFIGTVMKHEPPPAQRSQRPYRILLQLKEGGHLLQLVFFHTKGDYLGRQLPVGQQRVVSGKVEQTGQGWQMVHPDIIAMPAEYDQVARLEPVYPLTYGLTQRKTAQLIQQVLKLLTPLPEWQDKHWLEQKQWPDILTALNRLHQPVSREDLSLQNPAFQRLVYDELLASQLALALIRQRIKKGWKGKAFAETSAGLAAQLRQHLPFTLTEGQENALTQISEDLASGQRMLRLLQGDVGSGKTVVALLAMASVIEAGAQAALMVPTEILGRQHLAFMKPLLSAQGIEIAMLSGSTEAQERQRILHGLAEGKIQLVIGTHALFQESVAFQNLGLVVIDEQHRFGVQQRLALAEKGEATHILLMTATPIPRSLTLTLFGDMDVSILNEKPKGRQAIATKAIPLTRYEEVIKGIKRALDAGEKIYWICPLVEGSDQPTMEELSEDHAAATLRYKEFQAQFGEKVTLAHGRMKAEEREAHMARFASGESRLLVATTVVEVGVDVPDATIMVIEHAERFGLAQLHQLRGRVGRGSKPSSCLLLYGTKTSQSGRDRLRVLRESNDGFLIAEEDLRLRGSGELLGTRQSGVPEFHFADLSRDAALLQVARDECKLILHQDAALNSERGKALRCLLYLFEHDKNVRLLASG